MTTDNKWQNHINSKRSKAKIDDSAVLQAIEKRCHSENPSPAELLERELIYFNEAQAIDIEKVPVSEKTGFKGKVINLYRKIVWKLLGFQIHHLAIQQNYINSRTLKCLKLLKQSIEDQDNKQ